MALPLPVHPLFFGFWAFLINPAAVSGAFAPDAVKGNPASFQPYRPEDGPLMPERRVGGLLAHDGQCSADYVSSQGGA